MAKQKPKRNKKYNPHKVHMMMERYRNSPLGNDPLLVAKIMKPLDEMLDELDRLGTLTTVGEGENEIPIGEDWSDGETYELLPAARGFIELFELYEKRYNQNLYLGPMRNFIKKLDYKILVSAEDIRDAKLAADRIRQAVRSLTKMQASDLVKTIQIRQEFERMQDDPDRNDI